jgi:predicted nucleic acid-binding protein
MLYLDSNIFIYAALNTGEYGSRARSLLQKIQGGEERAATSVLTFDETYWSVKKQRGTERALEAGEALLNFPNLELIPVNGELLAIALNLIKKYRLDPRDAIHAATAITKKADAVVSTDAHFDKVKELRRRSL